MAKEELETKSDTEYDPSYLSAAVSITDETPRWKPVDQKKKKRKLILSNEIFGILLEKESRKNLKALIDRGELSQEDYDTIERVLSKFYERCHIKKGTMNRWFGDNYCDPRQKAVIIGHYMEYGQGINTCTPQQKTLLFILGRSLINDGVALDEESPGHPQSYGAEDYFNKIYNNQLFSKPNQEWLAHDKKMTEPGRNRIEWTKVYHQVMDGKPIQPEHEQMFSIHLAKLRERMKEKQAQAQGQAQEQAQEQEQAQGGRRVRITRRRRSPNKKTRRRIGNKKGRRINTAKRSKK